MDIRPDYGDEPRMLVNCVSLLALSQYFLQLAQRLIALSAPVLLTEDVEVDLALIQPVLAATVTFSSIFIASVGE